MDCIYVDGGKLQIIAPILFLMLLQYLVQIFVRNEAVIFAGYCSFQIADIIFSWLQYLSLPINCRTLEASISAPAGTGKKETSVSGQ